MGSGYLGAAALWYACVAWLPLESFRRLPDPVAVATEWLSPHPTYGISIFTAAYYKHMLYSTWRATAAFAAATLNTAVGVKSIDPDFFRAAACLGASRHDILVDVVLPGALPNIFTGLQIAMGAAWFSLAAGEMIAAQ